jgi:hypothetical protein
MVGHGDFFSLKSSLLVRDRASFIELVFLCVWLIESPSAYII